MIDNYMLKNGDLKINKDDLISLLKGYEYFQNILFNNLEILDENESKEVQSIYEIYLSFFNKYIISGDLRRKEFIWFSLLKKLDELAKDISKNSTDDGVSIGFYIDRLSQIVEKEIEITEEMLMILKIMIQKYEYDMIRRSIYEKYIQIKGERERYNLYSG